MPGPVIGPRKLLIMVATISIIQIDVENCGGFRPTVVGALEDHNRDGPNSKIRLKRNRRTVMDIDLDRRHLMLAPFLLALASGLSTASAGPLNPAQTIITLRDNLQWKSNPDLPEKSVDMCPLFGDPNSEGLYYTLLRWWPGYMSAPHKYTTDRLCVVVSGTWWCNSGADFDPASCVPAPAGSFVRRVADTPHYDGVIKDHHEPAVIAICGIAPVNLKILDPYKSLAIRL